jgi:hypothetical protein
MDICSYETFSTLIKVLSSPKALALPPTLIRPTGLFTQALYRKSTLIKVENVS